MLMAAMALFTSCNNDEVLEAPASKQDIKFNFTFEKVDEDGTRALKSAWADGDIVYIMFANQFEGYLKCTYNGSTWTTETVGTLNLSESETYKKLSAMWIEGNNQEVVLNKIHDTRYSLETKESVGWYSLGAKGDYVYNKDTKTVTASLTFSLNNFLGKMSKITVKGLDSSKSLKLISPCLITKEQPSLYSGPYSAYVNYAATYSAGDKIPGIVSTDGVYFNVSSI